MFLSIGRLACFPNFLVFVRSRETLAALRRRIGCARDRRWLVPRFAHFLIGRLACSRNFIRIVALSLVLAGCTSEAPVIVDFALLSDTRNTAGPYEFSAVVRDDGAVEEVLIYYRLRSDPSFAVLEMRQERDTLYRASLPGLPLDTAVSYFVEARDNDGNSSRAPAQGVWTFRVGQPPEHPSPPMDDVDDSSDLEQDATEDELELEQD
ncbi:MAG: hypothetical protein RBU37_12355 [Myxococcota bacterium]|jgi:hypothetical protein|nr:hypothetical protein [Myxococcota bacterium]